LLNSQQFVLFPSFSCFETSHIIVTSKQAYIGPTLPNGKKQLSQGFDTYMYVDNFYKPIRCIFPLTCKVQKDKQRSTKHTHKTKDRVTRTRLKTVGELRCTGRI